MTSERAEYALLLLIESERALLRGALIVVALGLVYTTLAFFLSRARSRKAAILPTISDWPRVTVQLPMKDEFYVARRAIVAAGALDYPRDRLQIQVLDDSEDETRAIADRAVSELQALGVDIEVVRRRDRAGFKAGHLAYGLARARGEHVAIFDADFVPRPDFLKRTIPHLVADPKLAMVQARWSFLNRDRSLLTRAQAVILDGLMIVDQAGKSARGWPFQFNGSAGVWRREAIADAGGWRGDSLVEDLDLSYRAILKGWRFLHLADLDVPTELPESMAAFRAQQTRWTLGNAQLLVRLWRPIVKSDLSAWHQLSMLMHLGGRAVYLFIALLTVTMPVITFGFVRPHVDYSLRSDAMIFAAVALAFAGFHLTAQRASGQRAIHAVFSLPFVLALHVGISLLSGTAFLRGLFTRRGVFVRTPKSGADESRASGPAYLTPRDAQSAIESALAVACAFCGALAAAEQAPVAISALYIFLATSFAWVGFSSLTLIPRKGPHPRAHEGERAIEKEGSDGKAHRPAPQSLGK